MKNINRTLKDHNKGLKQFEKEQQHDFLNLIMHERANPNKTILDFNEEDPIINSMKGYLKGLEIEHKISLQLVLFLCTTISIPMHLATWSFSLKNLSEKQSFYTMESFSRDFPWGIPSNEDHAAFYSELKNQNNTEQKKT